MEENINLIQIQKKIISLINEEKYQKAYDICKESLEDFAYNKKLNKLKRKIEKIVSEKNQKYIKKQLKEVKKLKKQNNFIKILNILDELLKLSPNNKKLKNLYLKAEENYKKELIESEKNFLKKQKIRLEKILNENHNLLITELFELEKNNINNIKVKKITDYFREKLITIKIKNSSNLLKSEKYYVIENLIKELKEIKKDSIQIKELEKEINKQQFGIQVEEKKEFLYANEKNLETLMKLKKYSKASQLAKEILTIDKNNKKIKKTLNKAEKKSFKENKNKVINHIYENLEELKKAYKENKKQFIKI